MFDCISISVNQSARLSRNKSPYRQEFPTKQDVEHLERRELPGSLLSVFSSLYPSAIFDLFSIEPVSAAPRESKHSKPAPNHHAVAGLEAGERFLNDLTVFNETWFSHRRLSQASSSAAEASNKNPTLAALSTSDLKMLLATELSPGSASNETQGSHPDASPSLSSSPASAIRQINPASIGNPQQVQTLPSTGLSSASSLGLDAGRSTVGNSLVDSAAQAGPSIASTPKQSAASDLTNAGGSILGLSIPQSHPRIWWTPERLAQGRAWYAAHPFTPKATDPWNNALVYVLTGNKVDAQNAINSLMAFTITDSQLSQTSCDVYRWNDWVPVVYDWVHDAMSSAQRQTFTERYNHYAETMMQKKWGSPSMPGNNYFWGYFRNEFNWAVASYHENSMAPAFLEDALLNRWQNSFLPYAASGSALGGVAPEGSQYGRYMLAYSVMPLVSSQLLGRDLWGETSFYKDALFQTIYATTPALTFGGQGNKSYYQIFPFDDDETSGGYPTAGSSYLGDFMTAAAEEWTNSSEGQFARQWLNMVQPHVDNYLKAVDLGGSSSSFSSLPTDYYAPGSQYLYTRDQWGPSATSLFLQLGQPGGIGHSQQDAGSFQIWRAGDWLSKASTGYSLHLAGGITSRSTAAHNGILFNGMGLANAYQDGTPKVLRLESTDTFSYAVVDLSASYRAHASSHPLRDDNPYAAHVVREFLFIKPLQTLITLDRLESSSDAVPAADVKKTFLLHFPLAPQIHGNTVTGINGNEELKLTALTSGVSFDVVNEGAFAGPHQAPSYYQYRLEENASGHAQTCLLNVMQCKTVGGPDVSVTMAQNNNSWTIHLDSPALGHAVVVLQKGMVSVGGALGYSAASVPTSLTPLIDHVQSISVTDQGPQWGA
jgi:hypothetical protein